MRSNSGRPAKGQEVFKNENWENDRVKISHYVRRNNIEKKCVICGKQGSILHNRENPYMIAFICDDCRKDPKKLEEAEKLRFDIRDRAPKKGSHILKTSTDEYVTSIVSGYLQDTLPIREYCKKKNISNRQFHTILNRYKELYPQQPIDSYIKSHRDTVHRYRIQQSRSVEV